jgi:GNAT superfamily N-acetyltransferase
MRVWTVVADWIRDYRPEDEEAVVRFSLRAWAPVFRSLERVLGPEIFAGLHPDWRHDQENAVRGTLADPATRAWVSGAGDTVTGFAAATLHRDRRMGEITMLAVDPQAQSRGIGANLTEVAGGWLRDVGMTVAMIDTGGDAGHAPARRVYEKAGYTLLPVARYFKHCEAGREISPASWRPAGPPQRLLDGGGPGPLPRAHQRELVRVAEQRPHRVHEQVHRRLVVGDDRQQERVHQFGLAQPGAVFAGRAHQRLRGGDRSGVANGRAASLPPGR